MGVADDAEFVVGATIDKPEQDDVPQQPGKITRNDVLARRVRPSAAHFQPIVEAPADNRAFDLIQRNDARGTFGDAARESYDVYRLGHRRFLGNPRP